MRSRLPAYATAAAALLAAPAMLGAQVPDASACAGMANAVCVAQVGDFNAATVDQSEAQGSVASVRIEGSFNGGGSIAGRSAELSRMDGTAGPALLVTPALESGLVRQSGELNRATVRIEGERNQFHVAQHGSANAAVQLVRGDGNAVATVQANGSAGNVAQQVQLGSDNVSILTQAGAANRATLIQAPSAEAALLGAAAGNGEGALVGAFAASTGAAGVAGNQILLEQNGDGNQADLVQAGTDQSIALRQQGGAQISITQHGTGRSVAVEQTNGSQGIQIVQY